MNFERFMKITMFERGQTAGNLPPNQGDDSWTFFNRTIAGDFIDMDNIADKDVSRKL